MMIFRTLTFYLFVLYSVQSVSTESLLDRLYAAASEDDSQLRGIFINDKALDQQLTLPRHSAAEVARFRGKPIMPRQTNTIVDENGVAVPFLPYNGRKASIPHRFDHFI